MTPRLRSVALAMAVALLAAGPVSAQAPKGAGAPGPSAAPADPVAQASARLAAFETDGKRIATEVESEVTALSRSRAALATRLAQAAEPDRPALSQEITALDERLGLARDRARAAQARVTAQRKLLSVREASARRRREGAGALGIVVPTSDRKIDQALAGIEAERAGLQARTAALADAKAERTARAAELQRATTQRDASRAALAALPKTSKERPGAEAALVTAEARAALATLRDETAAVRLEQETQAVEEARAVLALREATLSKADAEAVTAARARGKKARAEAVADAAAKRREDEVRAQERLQAMREEAARRAELASARLEKVRTPEVKRLLELEKQNADRLGRLADLEERRREVTSRVEAAATAWEAEAKELARQQARATAHGLTTAEIDAHLKDLRARRERLEAAAADALEEREASAEAAAKGFRDARRTVERHLAALASDAGSKGLLGQRTRAGLEEARRLLGALAEAAGDTARGFDRLWELREVRRRAYAAELEAEAFQVRILGNTRSQWLRAAVIAGATLVLSILATLLLRILLAATRRTAWTIDEVAVKKLRGPARLALVLVGVKLLLEVLTVPARVSAGAQSVLAALVIVAVAYALYNLVDVVRHGLEPLVASTETKLDDQLLPLISKIAKGLVLIVGFVEVANAFGYNLTSVLAGVGVGGVAIALAAKDTVSNLFGSIMIFTDKPFEVGDWIKLKGCEGTVEAIGLRSTRVRTWEDTLVSIPNSQIGSAKVENVSRFKARRVYVNLGLRYDTPLSKITRAVEIVREILVRRKDVKKGHYVFFNDLKDSALNVMVYYFVGFTTWRIYLTTRQEVTLEIMQRFEEEGIRFAFPTTTVEVEQATGRSPLPEEVAPTRPVGEAGQTAAPEPPGAGPSTS